MDLYRAERCLLSSLRGHACRAQGAAALCALICRVTALGSHNQGLPTMGWWAPHTEMEWGKGGFSQLLGDAMSGCSRVNF